MVFNSSEIKRQLNHKILKESRVAIVNEQRFGNQISTLQIIITLCVNAPVGTA